MRSQLLKKALLTVGLLALVALPAVAEDKSETEKKAKHLVFGDQFENIVISTEGSELTITMTEDGKSKVAMVDMAQVGLMVGESMAEVTEALAEMQMEFRLGQDNSFSFALEDEQWQVDLDAILSEVGEALSGAFAGMDTDDWAHHRHHGIEDGEEADLQEELDSLRQELKDLQQELEQLRKNRNDG